jgi:hypothetical protein
MQAIRPGWFRRVTKKHNQVSACGGYLQGEKAKGMASAGLLRRPIRIEVKRSFYDLGLDFNPQ